MQGLIYSGIIMYCIPAAHKILSLLLVITDVKLPLWSVLAEKRTYCIVYVVIDS